MRGTVAVAVFVGTLAGFEPLDFLIDLTSRGTLVVFTVVSIGSVTYARTHSTPRHDTPTPP